MSEKRTVDFTEKKKSKSKGKGKKKVQGIKVGNGAVWTDKRGQNLRCLQCGKPRPRSTAFCTHCTYEWIKEDDKERGRRMRIATK